MPRAQPVPADAPLEPDWLLRSMPYSDYRGSNWWRRRRAEYVAAQVTKRGRRVCELCQLGDPEVDYGIRVPYHVHHVSYQNLGKEPDSDLRLLCSPCHNLVHYPDSNAGRHWAALAYNSSRELDAAARLLDPNRLRAID